MADQIETTVVETPKVETPVAETPKVETAPIVETVVPAETKIVETSVETKIEPAKVEAEDKPDWRDKRIAQLTARLREKEPLKQTDPGKPAATTTAAPGTAEFDTAVQAQARVLAQQEAAQIAFNRACDDLAAKGKEAFPDFDARIANFGNIVSKDDQGELSAYYTMVATAIETGEGARILHELGGDLNEAARIMALPPTKMAIELTKRATGASPERQVSAAPKPITPIGRTLTNDAEIKASDPVRGDKLSTKTWMERRQAEVNAQWARENPGKRRSA